MFIPKELRGGLEHAIIVATMYHVGQVDKGFMPYILHPLRVMNNVDGYEARIVGVLHDVVEDTEATIGALMAAGFSDTVTDAVGVLTKHKNENYMHYITQLALNPLAREVKLADLADNMDTTRLPGPLTEKDVKRLAKYQRAHDVLLYWLT